MTNKQESDRRIAEALAKAGIERLNEMQQAVLDTSVGQDIVLVSPTGSGKTLAFLLPLLARLVPGGKNIQALIVAPSRELALQIETVFRSLGSGFKVNCCYGGHPIRSEKKSLEYPPAVLIGTPGRIVDHIERGHIQPETAQTLVLDEFDKSLEFGFTAEMKKILDYLSGVDWRILTSATASIDIPTFAGLNNPRWLSFLSDSRPSVGGLTVRMVKSPVKDKLETLYRLLGELEGASALVFCNLREAVERVGHFLSDRDVDNECFHGGMEQPDRERALARFRNGSTAVFISTDLAARGLDIEEIKYVIHYHLPVNEESYIHRNGRTGRMHAQGNVFMILNEVEHVPEYIRPEPDEFFLPEKIRQPQNPDWVTLTINKGKRDNLSRKDVAGFLFRKGGLDNSRLGMIEVRESFSFAAVKRTEKNALLERIKEEKIKNMKARFS